MTDPEDDDRWLDAFSSEDVDDPELAAFNAAVSRLVELARAPEPVAEAPSPRRSWVGWAFVAVAVAAVLIGTFTAFQLLDGLPSSAPPSDRPEVAESNEGPAPTPPPEVKVPTPAPESAVAEASERRGVERPARQRSAPLPDRSPQPGLFPSADAVVDVRDGTAHLAGGSVRYWHDATHEPGVRAVAWDQLPVLAVPVGTRFTAVASRGLAAIEVREGTVAVEHRSGVRLSTLSAGDELVLFDDSAEDHGVRLIQTGAMTTDELRDLPLSDTTSDAVFDVVTWMRLARLHEQADEEKP